MACVVTDRPILLSAPMVRAAWGGLKTNTRRLLYAERKARGAVVPPSVYLIGYPTPLTSPAQRTYWTLAGYWHKAKPGDRLWVREVWQSQTEFDKATGRGASLRFAANWTPGPGFKWRSPIHMPRWASRLTLVVTATKIERLRDISEADAQAEGARRFDDIPSPHPYPASADRWSMENPTDTDQCLGSASAAFGSYWEKLHGPGGWYENPWVVALSFVVHRCNIDKMPVGA
jgi:hypothetical protein